MSLETQCATVPTTTSDELNSREEPMAITASPPLRIPPLSFALVSPGVYRSGCPMPLNFPFLSRLRLKSIVYLADQELPPDLQDWAANNNVKVFHFRVQHRVENAQNKAEATGHNGIVDGDEIAHKKEKSENDPETTRHALQLLLDRRNFPVLIHSNKGKHRSGVLVACMRKLLQNWDFQSVKLEYHLFAGEKGQTDIQFIERFEPVLEYNERWAPDWLRYSPEEGKLKKLLPIDSEQIEGN